MNVKDNSRSKQTRKMLQDAFLETLKENNYKKANVTSICKKAGLNRSSFYYYYEDIYSLTSDIREQIHEEIDNLFGNEINDIKDALINGKRTREASVRLFELIKKNRNFFHLYFTNHFSIRAFSGLSYKECFYTAGIRAIAAQWIDRGCKESTEEMADIFEEILQQ